MFPLRDLLRIYALVFACALIVLGLTLTLGWLLMGDFQSTAVSLCFVVPMVIIGTLFIYVILRRRMVLRPVGPAYQAPPPSPYQMYPPPGYTGYPGYPPTYHPYHPPMYQSYAWVEDSSMRERLSLPGVKELFFVFILAIVVGGLSLYFKGASLIVFPICFLIAFSFPSLMWVSYVYSKDIHSPEPGRNVFIALTWGMISTIPAMVINTWAGMFMSFTLVAVMVAPLGEELLKPLGLSFLKPDINNELDGVIYGVSCGMGFALIENLNYELSFVLIQLFPDMIDPEALGVTWTESLWSLGSLARGLGSTIIHALGAAFIGFAYARFLNRKGATEGVLVVAYVAAVSVHAAWNGVASTEIDAIAVPAMFIFPVIAFFILRYLVLEARRCEEATMVFSEPRRKPIPSSMEGIWPPGGGQRPSDIRRPPDRPFPPMEVHPRFPPAVGGVTEVQKKVDLEKSKKVDEARVGKTEEGMRALRCPRCEMNFRPPMRWTSTEVQCPYCGMSFRRAQNR